MFNDWIYNNIYYRSLLSTDFLLIFSIESVVDPMD